MESEWSIECGVDDPVIEVPWSDEQQSIGFEDLGTDPAAIERLPEVREWPELKEILLVLNSNRRACFTSKCDAWLLDEEERELDFGTVASGIGSYLDVVWKSRALFTSLDAQRRVVERLVDRRHDPALQAFVKIVIRHATVESRAGFAWTIYVYGYGQTEEDARREWVQALAVVTKLIADDVTIGHAGE